jgi:hypothetical protein
MIALLKGLLLRELYISGAGRASGRDGTGVTCDRLALP